MFSFSSAVTLTTAVPFYNESVKHALHCCGCNYYLSLSNKKGLKLNEGGLS